MTREKYAESYARDFLRTQRFLISKRLSPDEALELAQEAWTKGLGKLDQLEDTNSPLSWVNSIAFRLLLDYHKEKRRIYRGELTERYENINVAAIDLRTLLAGCSDGDKLLLVLHHMEGVSMPELAQKYGLTEVAVRVRVHRARGYAKRVAMGGR